MDAFTLYAEALRYPYQGQIDTLFTESQASSSLPGITQFSEFMTEIKTLSLAEREELYTITFDLNPLSAPYVGYQIWGENYTRGEFMANLNHEMSNLDIDMENELPDHLIPILRYLSATTAPLPELTKVLGQSVAAMKKSLKKAEGQNPYSFLIDAIAEVCRSLPMEA